VSVYLCLWVISTLGIYCSCSNACHQILINNLEVWLSSLSGLRHWLAKSVFFFFFFFFFFFLFGCVGVFGVVFFWGVGVYSVLFDFWAFVICAHLRVCAFLRAG